jgi:hypothetical protein
VSLILANRSADSSLDVRMPTRISLLIGAACLSSLSALAKNAEVDWWRTSGAAVVEHLYKAGGMVCSLFLYNQAQAVVVTWGKTDAKEVSFYDEHWQFQTNQPVSAVVRIGTTWLGESSDRGPPIVMAVGGPGRLSVPLSQSVESPLRTAAQITMLSGSSKMDIDVDRRKMPALLKAVKRCRAALK